MTKEQYLKYRNLTIKMLKNALISITKDEEENIEVADFGLNRLDELGLQILTYINTERVCAKEETFRCRKGLVYLYVEGEKSDVIHAKIPQTKVSVFHEIILNEGEQYTIYPNTLHWFQAGPEGAIISEFSTKSTDDLDVFTDDAIIRTPLVE
jgi:D-lyxose ketol-isomerase